MAQIIDMDIMSEAKSTMRNKFGTMVEYFLEDAQGYIGEIRYAARTGELPLITAPAHTLKSSAKQIGAAALSEISQQIEELSRLGKDDGSLKNMMEELEETYTQTYAALTAVAIV